MRRFFFALSLLVLSNSMTAQDKLNEELLWSLKRLSGETLSPDGQAVYFGIAIPDIKEDRSERNIFSIKLDGTGQKQITTASGNESNLVVLKDGSLLYSFKGRIWSSKADGSEPKAITPEGMQYDYFKLNTLENKILFSRDVKVFNTTADLYPDLQKSKGRVFDALFYRHWDQYADAYVSHVFIADFTKNSVSNEKDIMSGESFDCPQQPMGGTDDFLFSADGNRIYYVSKKVSGTPDALSTNTDIYEYSISAGTTVNISNGLKGFDTHPGVSGNGEWLCWLSMARDGYESDKNDLILYHIPTKQLQNLTKDWDNTVQEFIFSKDHQSIYFTAYTQGSKHLHQINIPSSNSKSKFTPTIKTLTRGDFDVADIIGQTANAVIYTRTDMNHAPELFYYDIPKNNTVAITNINKDTYDKIRMCPVEKRMIKTTDQQQMLTWIVYPPDFDPTKKYPALLYCQGGPQSAVSQFYSYRWNFQLMASKGYIVIAPNRRGLPGFGTSWNEQISGDWGGQAMSDYLAAVDSMKKLPFIDASRIGAVGASYGGYSVYMLAGIHNNRFKTFIAHCGLFDLRSWYGSTEEMWFANWDIGGPYWDERYKPLYQKHDPINYAANWNTPILVIHGGLDYRVPETQGMEAFQLAQVKGIKSRFVYFPDEGHWILKPQNGILWQREFYRWLNETL